MADVIMSISIADSWCYDKMFNTLVNLQFDNCYTHVLQYLLTMMKINKTSRAQLVIYINTTNFRNCYLILIP